MRSSILQRIKLVAAISPAAAQAAGTVNGNVIDRYAPVPAQPTGVTAYTAVNDASGVYNTATIGVGTGASTGAPTTQSTTFKLQHGALANGSDMVDVPASAYVDLNGSNATIPSLSADNTNTQIGVILEGLNRYIRVVITEAFTGGTTPAQFLTSYVVLGDGNGNPAS